jgi:hypothetical protein
MLEMEMTDTNPTLKECDELFRKYQADGWIGPTSFKAALREYGLLELSGRIFCWLSWRWSRAIG